MADYECYPLWWVNSDKAGDIDPETLPLSQETITRLEKWADIYEGQRLEIFGSHSNRMCFFFLNFYLFKIVKKK